MRDRFGELMFLSIYGSPLLQAAVGVDPAGTASRKAGKDPMHRQLLEQRIAEIKSRIPVGGVREATIRALLYAGMGRAAVDERSFEAVRRIRQAHESLSLPEFKALVREQYFMLLIDQDAALAAIPGMLPPETEARRQLLDLIKQVLAARGELSAEDRRRLEEVERLFGGVEGTVVRAPFRQEANERQARAS
jgi:hypothetical protein